MKRFAALSALLLFYSFAHAQDAPTLVVKSDVSRANTEDAGMKILEEQVRMLAGEVAILRSELAELCKTKSPERSCGPQVLLASARPEPGVLLPAPAPAPPEVVETQSWAGDS